KEEGRGFDFFFKYNKIIRHIFIFQWMRIYFNSFVCALRCVYVVESIRIAHYERCNEELIESHSKSRSSSHQCKRPPSLPSPPSSSSLLPPSPSAPYLTIIGARIEGNRYSLN
uniref:Uncharacterized protein n=1 Tax=Parascaris univalens TaxID=6257 RepID=A0A915AL56_PARUN